jgi:hypothetical protein
VHRRSFFAFGFGGFPLYAVRDGHGLFDGLTGLDFGFDVLLERLFTG